MDRGRGGRGRGGDRGQSVIFKCYHEFYFTKFQNNFTNFLILIVFPGRGGDRGRGRGARGGRGGYHDGGGGGGAGSSGYDQNFDFSAMAKAAGEVQHQRGGVRGRGRGDRGLLLHVHY